MNDRSRQNPAYRLARYAPSSFLGSWGVLLYTEFAYKITFLSRYWFSLEIISW